MLTQAGSVERVVEGFTSTDFCGMPTPISHYCQKCLAGNPLGQEFCTRCGTRLMLIVETPSARFDLTEQSIPTDEHLLERISAVENRLSRLTERLERSLDLLLRQAQNSYFDRSLVKTLISILSEDGLVEASRLERLWSDRCEKDANEQQQSSHREEMRLKILAEYSGGNRRTFEDLIDDAFHSIAKDQVATGIDKLQRAAELNVTNASLNLFIGEHFFRNGKTEVAQSYLIRARDASPEDVRILLLLGLTCADNGDSETAKELLASAIKRGGSCFSGHYGLGWLYLAENNSRKALTEFKRALGARPSPEAHFVLASLYYRLDRDQLAGRHLRKAVKMDENYVEAFHLLAMIYERGGQMELAKKALAHAGAEKSRRTKSRKSPLKQRLPKQKLTETLKMSRLLTGRDWRLQSALREDALQAFLIVQSDGN